LQVLFALVALALIVSLPSPLHAQTFQTVPALAFTKAFAQAETAASGSDDCVYRSIDGSLQHGRDNEHRWRMAVSLSRRQCLLLHPLAVSANRNRRHLAAGTYTGQIVITNYSKCRHPK